VLITNAYTLETTNVAIATPLMTKAKQATISAGT